MKKLFAFLLIFCALVSVKADSIITATLTITNAPTTNGQTIAVNGFTKAFTNAVSTPSLWIATNADIVGVQTNIYNNYLSYPAASTTVSTNSTNQVLWQGYPGYSLTVTVSTGWATVSYSTNSITNATVVRVPYTVEGTTTRATIANSLVDYINQSTSGQIALNHLTNTVQNVVGGSFSGGITAATSVTVGTILNVPSPTSTSLISNLNIGKLGMYLNSGWIDRPNVNAGVFTNSPLLKGPILTNTPLIYYPTVTGGTFNNVTNAGTVYSTNFASSDNPHQSFDFGDGALTYRPMTWNDGDGAGAVINSPNGFVAINSGQMVVTNSTGTALLIPDRLQINRELFVATNNSSLANGNNASVAIGNASWVKVSGPTAAFSINGIFPPSYENGRSVFIENATGYAMTIANDSGFDSSPGNRIYTSTGADMTFTNNPCVVRFVWRSTLSRWELVGANVFNQTVTTGGSATNAVSTLNGLSNALTLTWTNVPATTNGIRSVIAVGTNSIVISNAFDTNIYATVTQLNNATNSQTNFALLNGANTFTGPSNTFNGPLALNTNAIIQSVPVSGATKVFLSPEDTANTIALCIGPTNNAIASVVALEDSDDPSASLIYRAAGEHDMHFAVGGADKMAVRSSGIVNYTASNIELDDSGNLHITGKLTADGTVDPPGFLADANTRAGAKARDLLEVPDAITNIYWIGLIGTNNTHRLLSNEVFSTVIRTNDLGRDATYTNKVNAITAAFLAKYPNALNGIIARTNVQATKLDGMFVYNMNTIPRLEQYRASDDTYWTVAGLQITNSLPTTNQVISAMQAIIAAKQAKAALTQ